MGKWSSCTNSDASANNNNAISAVTDEYEGKQDMWMKTPEVEDGVRPYEIVEKNSTDVEHEQPGEIGAKALDDVRPSTDVDWEMLPVDFQHQDALQLYLHAAAFMGHTCNWVTPHGVCGSLVQGLKFSEHLRSCHGIRGPDKEILTCRWYGCFVVMNKESLERHVNEIHIGMKYLCPHCSELFTRSYTLQTHMARKHSGN
ncbi:hypothetical protein HD554DRAFT_2101052 [Boletus coccyginus]|nr:hypothetical protein HD554DRAFT_2101052 [Boletus coccyginus]